MNPTIFSIVILALVAAFAIFWLLGQLHWRNATHAVRDQLRQAHSPTVTQLVDFGLLEPLPKPVQRYLRRVLKDGQVMIRLAHFKHRGRFNMGESSDRWKPFTSDQLVTTQSPGFNWDGRVRLFPGCHAHVHDSYLAGTGGLVVALLGLIKVIDLHDRETLASDELMRFLAESVWYPTALFPGQGVTWQAIDDHHALASLNDGHHQVSLRFKFNDQGLVESVYSPARGRLIKGASTPTPWQGKFWDYQEHHGVEVPTSGQVAWLTDLGEKAYWQGQLTDLQFEKSNGP